MSNPSLMRDLLAAAREEGPDVVERDAVWQKVAATTIGAGATTAVAAPAAKLAITKLLAIGGLIGAAGTALGVVVALNLGQSAAPKHATIAAAGNDMASATARALAPPAPTVAEPDTIELGDTPAPHKAKVAPPASARDTASQLAEEARLVTEARTALLAGDANRALTLVRLTHKLSARALEPEELVLEARALRALGDADGAAATELRLRQRFPAHSAAR